jgi:hypothetical protein
VGPRKPGERPHDRLPDHSSLTRIRQRWDEADEAGVRWAAAPPNDRSRRIFERTVPACVEAKVATGEVVHVDASLIRADVAWGSLAVRHVERMAEADGSAEVSSDDHDPPTGGSSDERRGVGRVKAARDEGPDRECRNSRRTGRFEKVRTTDPDATMATSGATSGRNRRLEPACRQHAVVDDARGVALDVAVTTGEANEGDHLLGALDRAAAPTGAAAETVTADAGYACAELLAGPEERAVTAVIPARAEPIRSPVPMRRFRCDARHDAQHDVPRCPRGKRLREGRHAKHGRFFASRSKRCRRCDLARLCPPKVRSNEAVVLANEAVVLGDHHPAPPRARRRRARWSEEDDRL